MPVESDGHSKGNPRLYELIEHAPKTGQSPTIWAWPQIVDYLKVAGQPVAGPWPPHQRPRPDPDHEEAGPVAVPDPASAAVAPAPAARDWPSGPAPSARPSAPAPATHWPDIPDRDWPSGPAK